MDRGAFLHSLEFLSPASKSTWPPYMNGALETQIVVKNHLLSVEPNKDVGPACFASEDGLDPAMFQFDICIMKTIIEDKSNIGGNTNPHSKLTSPAASSVSTSLSMSQSQSQTTPPSKHQPLQEGTDKPRSERMHVLFQVDGKHVFHVNLAMFRGIDLDEEPTAVDNSSSSGVPNLKLCFNSCTFRVFSQEALNDLKSYRDFATLKTAATLLKRAASTFQRLSIFQGNSFLNEDYQTWFPNGNSTHKEQSNTELQDSSDQDHDQETSEHSQENDRNRASSMRGIKRKRESLARSWNGLHSLFAVLEMPQTTANTDDTVSETIGPLLTASAELLTASYCGERELRNAMQSCNDCISSCETQLSNVFAASFPPPRNRRSHASPATAKTPVATQPPEENTDTLLETAHLLLQKQKDAVKQRLELSLLPIRDYHT